ncbi:hypothetical protein B0E42_11165 [Pseudomonas sp. A25(2017)]|nr:hypothetical protein B0E42_11165 [Pseudomonas sp. A25(2017)]
MWEQSLLAKQAPRFLRDRSAFIAGKPCSHINSLATRGINATRNPAQSPRKSPTRPSGCAGTP